MAQNSIFDKEKRPSVLKKSVIIKALMRFSEFIYDAIAKSVFGGIMLGGDTVAKDDGQSFFSRFINGGRAKHHQTLKDVRISIAEKIETSTITTALEKARRLLLSLTLTSYGVLLLSYGFYVCAVYSVRRFAIVTDAIEPLSYIVPGALAIPISIFMFASRKSLASVMIESRILSFFLFDFLGLRKNRFAEIAAKEARPRVGVPFIVGMVLGILTAVVPPLYIAIAALIILVVLLIMESPMSGMLAVLAVLPIAPTCAAASAPR
ncbi:MAG: hypothetical protein MJ101_01510, partial [Clostridia bacterium]|nr:hypothetical protein [Clostridia bacterium]